jgi:pyruvate/2-oxoglutarate dehydrogenase complex dihydrolipoamide dehydrogenase (E3) component
VLYSGPLFSHLFSHAWLDYRGIRAAGDVCMTLKFTNVAETSARLAVQYALRGRAERQSRLTIPWCTWCSPEIAHIGMRAVSGDRGAQAPSSAVVVNARGH